MIARFRPTWFSYWPMCLVVCAVITGCQGLVDGRLDRWKLPDAAPDALDTAQPEAATSPENASDNTSTTQSAERSVLACATVEVAGKDGLPQPHCVWIRTVSDHMASNGTGPQSFASDTVDSSTQPRWHYPDLDDILARPRSSRPDLRQYLSDSDRIVVANAAIGLARLAVRPNAERADTEQTEIRPLVMRRLTEAVRDPSLPLSMRQAAIESLAALDDPQATALLRELIDQYGRRGPAGSSSYHAELHAELLRGLAQRVDPADDSRFTAALASRSPRVLLEALAAWDDGTSGQLPPRVADLRTHSNIEVRSAALRTLARRNHPQAAEFLSAALRDYDPRVRQAAIPAVALLDVHIAVPMLEGLRKEESERVRSLAIQALAQLRQWPSVFEAVDDSAWRVRAEVARALSQLSKREVSSHETSSSNTSSSLARPPQQAPWHEATVVARKLLDDVSAEVQRQVVLAVAEWPLEHSGAILLEAMGRQAYQTRKLAADALADRWPPAADYSIDAPASRQAEVREQLQQRFYQQFGFVDPNTLTKALAQRDAKPRATAEEVERAQTFIARRDTAALNAMGPTLLAAVEVLVFEHHQAMPDWLYHDVLPRQDRVFDFVERLTDNDITIRRQAAQELVKLAAQRPLGRVAINRLTHKVMAEPDSSVWRDLLDAVANEGSEPAVRLAYAALSHPIPEIRRRACDFLANHAAPQHTAVLLPTLQDTNHAVLVAAVRAIGSCRGLQETGPLRNLLLSADEPLRKEIAVALTRLGDPAGKDALIRLSYSTDPQVRREVALAVGQTGDPALTDVLIRLLDDRISVQRAALEGLPRLVGHDVVESDENTSATQPTTREKVRQWKDWYQRSSVQAAPSPLQQRQM